MLYYFTIYQISGYQFSRVLIGSRNLEYPWMFTVLRPERKIMHCFAKVSEEDIVAINEATFFLSIRPGLLEAWLALTCIKYHGNL